MKPIARRMIVGFAVLCLASLPSWTQDHAASQVSPNAAVSVGPDRQAATTVPQLVRFSGVVMDASGKPVAGTVAATFSLFELPEGGNPLWVETQNVSVDEQGHYTVLLGATQVEGLPLDLFTSGKARWLSVQHQLPGVGEQPRVLLVGMPYALKASDADTLGGKPASAYMLSQQFAGSTSGQIASASAGAKSEMFGQSAQVQRIHPNTSATPSLGGSGTQNFIPLWTSSASLGNSVMFQRGGNVGVGTKTPAGRLSAVSGGTGVSGSSSGAYGTGVFGAATATTGNGTGVYGQTSSPGAAGVVGVANVGGTGLIPTGVYGVSNDPNGNGVGGAANATSGFAAGVLGASSSTSGTGVGGFATATSGITYGVTGSVSSSSGFGVLGQNSSATGGVGITGASYATSGVSNGVYGQSTSSSGTGVYGNATATTGATTGVFGLDSSASGTGVVGENTSNGGTGLVGLATAASGGIGVIGQTDSTDGQAGIFVANAGQGLILQGLSGSSLTQVFSVDASGNVTISGALTVGGFKSSTVKTPDGREVALYSVSSPENWFEDFGTATLKNGAAEVSIESGFLQTIDTADYHIFLTPNGDCRGLYVARKSPGVFLVRELGGGNSNVSFDYRIVARQRGVANVRMQQVHPIQVSHAVKASLEHLRTVRQSLPPVAPRPLATRIPTHVLPVH